jgi:hypothetical protein
MSRYRLAITACLCLLAGAAATAPTAVAATSDTQSQTVRLVNRQSVRLQLGSVLPYDFGLVDPLATYAPAGNENTATVWSNAAWRLMVRAAGPTFTEAPAGARTIPLGRLAVSGTRTVNLGAADKRIANGARTSNAGVLVPINYALTLTFADRPNTPGSHYEQVLIYTAVTP